MSAIAHLKKDYSELSVTSMSMDGSLPNCGSPTREGLPVDNHRHSHNDFSNTPIALLQPVLWQPEWAIGIPLIDKQHEHIVELTDEFRIALLEKQSKEQIHAVLTNLLSYAEEHFQSEDLMMLATGFEGQESHNAYHNAFFKQAVAWFQQFERDELEDPVLVLTTLKAWLVNEIGTRDTVIVDSLRHRGIDYANITSVSDVVPNDHVIELRRCDLAALILGIVNVITSVALCFVYESAIARFCILAVSVVLSVILVAYAHVSYQRKDYLMKARVARQLADNMLAHEIAYKIAVMDLDDIELMYPEKQGTLIRALKNIVEHLRMYMPHLPVSLLAMIKGENADDDEPEEDIVTQRTLSTTVASTPVNNRIRNQHHNSQHGYGTSPRTPSNRKNASPRHGARRGSGGSRSIAASSLNSTEGATKHRMKTKMLLQRVANLKTVSVMAVSMPGYSSRMADMNPDMAVEVQGTYITALDEVSKTNRGVTISVKGDNVLMAWNATNNVRAHAQLAAKAALQLKALLAKRQPELQLSIAVATGPALVGNMGSKTSITFTVLGQPVEQANALLLLNDYLKTKMLISHPTYKDIGELFFCRPVGAYNIIPQPAPPSSCRTIDIGHPLAYELAGSADGGNEEDEWMYALKTAEHPYAGFNVAYKMCSTSVSEGLKGLRAWVEAHPSDHLANVMLHKYEASPGSLPGPWTLGWL